MEGIPGTHETIHNLVKFYSQNPLPSSDSDREFLKYPLHLVHPLGLGIDHHDKLIKNGAVEEDAAEGVGPEEGTAAKPKEVDDSVFDIARPIAPSRRWMRGKMSREAAEKELSERGMINGRFLVRIKERKQDEVSLALSCVHALYLKPTLFRSLLDPCA